MHMALKSLNSPCGTDSKYGIGKVGLKTLIVSAGLDNSHLQKSWLKSRLISFDILFLPMAPYLSAMACRNFFFFKSYFTTWCTR